MTTIIIAMGERSRAGKRLDIEELEDSLPYRLPKCKTGLV
jgi:hypothetical protein